MTDRLAIRLSWMTGLRLAFLALLFGATAFFYLRGSLGEHPESETIVFIAIGSGFALAAVYAALLRAGKHLRQLAEAQIILDQLTWTAIVYVSGGATSGATSFYGLTCLVGAILIGLRGAALAAVSGLTVFAMMCGAFALGWIAPPSDQSTVHYVVTWEGMVYPLLVNGLGIVVVALLAGYLAERLRRTGGELAIAQERALAAERLAMLGRIAAGLAHEIRNPLGSISGSVEMLREAEGLSDEDKRLCDIIHGEAARLNHLVSDMMDLARPKKPEPQDVDVAELARDVVSLASKSERSGSGDVAVLYVGTEGQVFARCDGAQMRQVLWNLVRNAVQVSSAGATVTVAVAEEPKRVAMRVADEGPGISEDAASRIFDAFYTTRSHGAGIGLAVVRRIIDDHAPYGATIDVHSSGKGATFVVGLARADAAGRREPERAETADADRDVSPTANARSHSRA
jgi:signal transduction histidine kinase